MLQNKYNCILKLFIIYIFVKVFVFLNQYYLSEKNVYNKMCGKIFFEFEHLKFKSSH